MLLNYSIAFLLFCQSPWVKIVLLKFLPHRLLPSSSFWGKPYTTKQPRLHGDFPRRRGYFKSMGVVKGFLPAPGGAMPAMGGAAVCEALHTSSPCAWTGAFPGCSRDVDRHCKMFFAPSGGSAGCAGPHTGPAPGIHGTAFLWGFCACCGNTALSFEPKAVVPSVVFCKGCLP